MSVKLESITGYGHKTKTIKAPGTRIERVAQACDRCRAKKTKCDGQNPCSTCRGVGLECIVSDKLSRKAFPKGYTETLEERVRQLEAENKKLLGLVDLRDEQLERLTLDNNENSTSEGDKIKVEPTDRVTASNLSLLETNNSNVHSHSHDGSCPCGCSNPHSLHEKPVSVAGSLYDNVGRPISIAGSINLSDSDDSDSSDSMLSADEYNRYSHRKKSSHFAASNSMNREITPAPGAFAAATAIAQMEKNKVFQQQQQMLEKTANKQQMLTSLVATSIPRSTEETLCVPTLLARICQAYGYDSKPAMLAANTLASLKEKSDYSHQPSTQESQLLNMIMNRTQPKLSEQDATVFVRDLIKLPQRIEMDRLITIYFQEWGNALPIIDKNNFLKNYLKLTTVLEQGYYFTTDSESSYESFEKFGAIMILILSLSMFSNKAFDPQLKDYDQLIHEFIKPNCIVTQHCSIQSLQILALALQYCLATGDISTCYELRGRVISMAQQLRLHRCPAAVLGMDSSNTSGETSTTGVRSFMQAERRILFWCIYCLDVYSSLNLGVPRLLKDYEIECAMPFAGKNGDDDDDDNVNILIVNNTALSIVGKVSRFSLSVMLYCKVLATILDSIYSRFETGDIQRKAVVRDRTLDCWRRDLPLDLKFEMDINGLSLKDGQNHYIDDTSLWQNYNKQQLTLIFLYYHAKILIYLPIISKYGNHHNVGLSQKEQLTKQSELEYDDQMGPNTAVVSSVSLIQQSTIQILEVLKCIANNTSSTVLPIPINITREQSLFALLVAKGTLDYIKGGPLFNKSKQLLLDTIHNMNVESRIDIPGGLHKNSFRLLELTILSIFNMSKPSRRKILSPNQQPIIRTAVEREPRGYRNGSQYIPQQQIHATLPSQPLPVQPVQPVYTDVNTSGNGGFNDLFETDFDSLESILQFDPYKVNLNRSVVGEFAADGSLGLVPFLDMDDDSVLNNEYSV
ncbi:Regulatory protein CAT8 [Spathaspora sp. JA1]|nr:Regulatory protein CAT8 [Spathaspora sp. JA1]